MKRITALLVVLLCIFVLSACAPKTFVWDDLLLKDVLPSLETDKGEVVSNTNSDLRLHVEGFSEKQYNDYVQQCKEEGFLVDTDTTFGYEAFNDQGYGLRLTYYSSRGEMTIDLEAPREFGELEWPTQGIAASVPAPKSKIGKIEWEHSDSFLIYVAETSKEEYREYVERCAEAGFNIDYDKDENYYRADNEDGYSIDIDYEGFNIIRIRVDAPIEEDNYEEVLTEPSESASEPEESVSEPVDSDSGAEENENIENDVVSENVSFEEIYKAYKENELRADEKYKNNRYRITAKVNGMETGGLFNLFGGATLTMEYRVDSTVVFFFAEFEGDQEEALKTINVGDTITYEGECLSYGSWVDCELVTD